MIDPRFYFLHSPPSIEELANAGSAKVHQKALNATSIEAFSAAKAGDLTFVETSKNVDFDSIEASVCFSPPECADLFPKSTTVLVSKFPRWSFTSSAPLIASPKDFTSSSHAIDLTAKMETGVGVGPNVAIGADVQIGSGTTIGAGSAIWPGVTIGRNCTIGSNVTIKCANVGNSVSIRSGVVIGEPGFGLSIGTSGAADTPHFGRVVIQDNVSIGSNTCIDRGLFDDTLIGENCKIDNLCHIAHNVQIGAHSVLAAFCGIAGSTIIGTGCQFGGACSIADHVVVGNRVKLAGNSGLMSNIPDGETWGGFPAKPLKTWFRENVWLSQQVRKRK